MHPLISMTLFQAVLGPIIPSNWPTQATMVEDSRPETRIRYFWDGSRNLLGERSGGTEAYRERLELDESGRLLRWRNAWNGAPLETGLEYEYQDGRPVRGKEESKTITFHYSGERLDSLANGRGDTLMGYSKYVYDVQGRLVQVDDWYELNGPEEPRHRRFTIRYFLPDSIVDEYRYLDNAEEYGRTVFHLQGELPVRKVETDHWDGENSVLVTTWTYAGTISIRPLGRDPVRRFVGGLPDLLGRDRGARPAILFEARAKTRLRR